MDATRTDMKNFPPNEALPIEAPPSGAFDRAGRSRVASLALSILAAAVVIAGGWGFVFSFGDGLEPVAVGEDVAVSGGSFRVDAFLPEHMAPMQAGKFAASGMSMSAMGMDMAPAGRERFTVEVSLTGDEKLPYSPEDFRVSGDGMKSAAPIRSELEPGEVSGGASISGSMVFEVPENTENLALSFGGSRGAALAAEELRGTSHDH